MTLTEKQSQVLVALRNIARKNLFLYVESSPFLFQNDCKKLVAGDDYCVFGMGGLSWHIAKRVGLSTGAALSVIKQLQKKGFVICEVRRSNYNRPRYWWPVGFASQLCAELADSGL